MKKLLLFLTVVLMGMSMMAQTTYTMIASESELSAGDKVILVGFDNDGNAFVMSYQKTNNRHAVAIDVTGGTVTTTVATDPASQTEPFELTIGGAAGAWTFFDALNNGYLYAPGGGNYLKTQTTLDDKGQWDLEIEEDGFKPVSNGGAEQNIMRYNVTSTLFGCYKSTSNVNGLIYIFKEGGAPVIYPEPSNYPSTFYSTVEGTSVTLDWTDATGAQLPQKYLVVASTGSITVPQDGVPVANSDLAKNVPYGVEYVTFSGLNPGTAYTFAIFPYTNSGANINYKTSSGYPTASALTENVATIVSTNFATTLAPFTAFNEVGEQEWTVGSYNNTTYAGMNGYSGGTTYENVDWLVSPNLLAGGPYESITISFRNAYKFEGEPLAVGLSIDYDGVGDPTDYEWVNFTDSFTWSTGNFAWAESGALTINDFEGSDKLYLAFVYQCDNQQASSWEITDILVTGLMPAGVGENDAVAFNLYPNPANDNINIVAERDAQVQIIDMTGRMVMSIDVVEGENAVNVADLDSGVYFVRMNGAVVKFVKK